MTMELVAELGTRRRIGVFPTGRRGGIVAGHLPGAGGARAPGSF